MTATDEPGTARSPGISYQQLLDTDTVVESPCWQLPLTSKRQSQLPTML